MALTEGEQSIVNELKNIQKILLSSWETTDKDKLTLDAKPK